MDATELRILAALLGAPEETALEVLREVAPEQRWLEPALEDLAGRPLDRWQGEHTRLFIAGHPRTPCPPFASVWVEKRMHGGPLEALLQFYADLGLETAEMPADYLGTILECAALLAEQPERADAHHELWRVHLLPWLPDFTATLARESRLVIYRLLAQRLDDLCNEYRMATATAGAA